MKYNAIIFDLDGTLLNTVEDLADSMNRVLTNRGFPAHDTAAYCHIVGSGAVAFIQKTLPQDKLCDELVADCLAKFMAIYISNWNVKTHLYDGIAGMLDALTARSVRMGIFSNKPHDFLERCVQEYSCVMS